MTQTYRTLVRRELGSYFVSWTGYVVIAAALFLLGLCFVSLIQALNTEPTDQPIMELFYSTYYFWLILLLAAPIITMRSFALEKFTGTIETLMTAPVSDLEVVLAKFSAALIFYMLIWLPLVALGLIVRHFGHDPTALDWGTLAST
ncbi:MAG: ABC transporter permease, partial [Verrucomicrobia bacterium]|nr:ABC transporter permease [Verrucomicrobiota bacterium]